MQVSIVIPVYNEARNLYDNTSRLLQFVAKQDRMKLEVVIANNGSTDETLTIAHRLAREQTEVRVVHIDQKGRGRALKEVWLQSRADILSYMDADLSTDLSAFPQLIEAVTSGGHDIATGSRLLKPEWTTRCWKREVASRCYNTLVKMTLRTQFSDAKCGFKAITRRAAEHILPLVEDSGWFFDTELLVIAERLDYRIFDLPVHWVEGPESHVNIFQTAMDDMRGLLRLRRRFQNGLSRLGRSRGHSIAA